jgi:hypothetical protein
MPRPRRTHLTQVLFTIIELGKQMHHIQYCPQLIIDEQLKQQQPTTVLYPFETKDVNDVYLKCMDGYLICKMQPCKIDLYMFVEREKGG